MTNNEDLYKKLKKYAYQVSNPFCYTCYISLTKPKCHKCGSDDLMREVKGNGVEFGIEWVIKDILESNFEPINIEDHTEQLLNDVYHEPVMICGSNFGDQGTMFKQLDPVGFRCACVDESSNMFDNPDQYFTINESEYYDVYEIEKFLDEKLIEKESA